MKKIFLYAVILFCGLLNVNTPLVWGQDVDYSSKYWTKSVSVLTKDPDKDGRRVFEKAFAEQLKAWDVVPVQIAVMKRGLAEVLDRLANSNDGPKAYKTAVDVIFDQLKAKIQSASEPVVLINAVIMIGELNDSQKRGEKVVPYAKARAVLKDLLKHETPAVRIAALSGLARHASLGLRSEEREELGKIFAQYAFVPPAQGEAIGTPESQWMRLTSLQALGATGYIGAKNEIPLKLLASMKLEGKAVESPFYRRDLDRRIAAAEAFAKLPLNEDALHDMKLKPEDLYMAMTKLFLTAMCYEYKTDFNLQEGMAGEGMEFEGGMTRMAMAQNISPEEEAFQIRLWKQRTKAISSVFAWIFTNKNSNLPKIMNGNTKFLKTARKIRDISMMYDRAGLPTKKRATRNDEEEATAMAEMGAMESSVQVSDGRLSLQKMQNDMYEALTGLAEEMDIPLDIRKKRKNVEAMY